MSICYKMNHDVILCIASHLSAQDIRALSRVSRQYYQSLGPSSYVWQQYYLKHVGTNVNNEPYLKLNFRHVAHRAHYQRIFLDARYQYWRAVHKYLILDVTSDYAKQLIRYRFDVAYARMARDSTFYQFRSLLHHTVQSYHATAWHVNTLASAQPAAFETCRMRIEGLVRNLDCVRHLFPAHSYYLKDVPLGREAYKRDDVVMQRHLEYINPYLDMLQAIKHQAASIYLASSMDPVITTLAQYRRYAYYEHTFTNVLVDMCTPQLLREILRCPLAKLLVYKCDAKIFIHVLSRWLSHCRLRDIVAHLHQFADYYNVKYNKYLAVLMHSICELQLSSQRQIKEMCRALTGTNVHVQVIRQFLHLIK